MEKSAKQELSESEPESRQMMGTGGESSEKWLPETCSFDGKNFVEGSDKEMHLIKDENGNLCPHSHEHGHTHEHTHEDGHTHTHEHMHDHEHMHEHAHQECDTSSCAKCGGCSSEEDGKNKEIIALLTYMLQHNEHHAAELDEMAQKLREAGMGTAAEQISKGVSEFQKGNMYLGVALSMVKENQ